LHALAAIACRRDNAAVVTIRAARYLGLPVYVMAKVDVDRSLFVDRLQQRVELGEGWVDDDHPDVEGGNGRRERMEGRCARHVQQEQVDRCVGALERGLAVL
jgi:hypothetical protein